MVHQGYIEPHNAVGIYNADGQATIYCSTQGAFDVRSLSAQVLGMPVGKIKVVPGGNRRRLRRQDHDLSRAALGAALEEDRRAGQAGDDARRSAARHRPDLRLEDQGEDGRDQGRQTRRRGSLDGLRGRRVPGLAGRRGRDVRHRAVHHRELCRSTLTTSSSIGRRPRPIARRARPTPRSPPRPSSTSSPRSAESIRSISASRTASRKARRKSSGLRSSASDSSKRSKAIKNSPHYKSKLTGQNRGRGVASGFWFNAGMQSSATVNIHTDGTASVVTGSPDIGGSRASMAMITAEVLGLPITDVRPIVADTDSIGHTDVTGGSRVDLRNRHGGVRGRAGRRAPVDRSAPPRSGRRSPTKSNFATARSTPRATACRR